MPLVNEVGVLRLTYQGAHLATALYFVDDEGESGVATAIGDDVKQELVAALLLSSAVALLEPPLRVKVMSVIETLRVKANTEQDDELPF